MSADDDQQSDAGGPRVLVLGGTSWLGGAVAAHAVARGASVTCLARGRSGEVPPGMLLVEADRDAGAEAYAAVIARAWDLVVDVARQPGHVRSALQALSDDAEHWAFVSSCSVYARHDEPGADETAALLPAYDGDTAGPDRYGEAKVACEQAVTAVRGDSALVARAGLIVGRGDRSDRFGYWPGRFALAAEDGGPVLVPADLERRVQWVDVRDLAAWLVDAGLAGATGTVNATGPTTSLGHVLQEAAAVAGFGGETVAATDDRLRAADVEEFMGPRSLPLWLGDPEWQAFMDRDVSAARRIGLSCSPLRETMRSAVEHERALGLDRPRTAAGLGRADELEVVGRVRDAR
ncbi:NAD-dependent epimerase/dehydratase family protein [Terracoccus luteus]|uniref:Nucleoside-diphosphate-sugar epimerase n=1 Tax=Terracoccus luteus TaxID=53356 RepID=A0A839PTP7_9MICO|nr:NAD-dependent epimerase/dehydratase family protein [Terracoccus luteus]MBB2987638.1 nucleoside-diphosphate-sugar epimerase [Terracoccus luteus]MCP2173289.1 nucleoside-diphosphate-sugar epimerase [Terracoccus luteus]